MGALLQFGLPAGVNQGDRQGNATHDRSYRSLRIPTIKLAAPTYMLQHGLKIGFEFLPHRLIPKRGLPYALAPF